MWLWWQVWISLKLLNDHSVAYLDPSSLPPIFATRIVDADASPHTLPPSDPIGSSRPKRDQQNRCMLLNYLVCALLLSLLLVIGVERLVFQTGPTEMVHLFLALFPADCAGWLKYSGTPSVKPYQKQQSLHILAGTPNVINRECGWWYPINSSFVPLLRHPPVMEGVECSTIPSINPFRSDGHYTFRLEFRTWPTDNVIMISNHFVLGLPLSLLPMAGID